MYRFLTFLLIVSTTNCIGQDLDGKYLEIYDLLEAHQVEKAIQAIEEGFEEHPHDSKYYFLRGKYWHITGHNSRAKMDLKHSIKYDPEYFLAYYYLGVVNGELLDYIGSAKSFKKAIELNPKHLKTYYNAALTYGHLGDFFRAVNALDHAIDLDPKYAKAYYNRAYWKDLSNETPEAILDYEKALELDPSFVQAHNALAATLKQEGQDDKACKHWSLAAELGNTMASELSKKHCHD